jgi:tRNA threonylcarbamoyladenosine modification (KEOPS) complex Cgi121 subunit
MLKHLQEDEKYVEITGFRNVQIKDAAEFLRAVRDGMPAEAEVQLFDADLVASWQHLYFAVLNALMAFRTGRNISKSVAVEVMLYASAQRQIKKAIELIGVTKNTANLAAVVVSGKAESVKRALAAIANCISAEPDERVLELSTRKVQRIRRAFAVSDLELETVATKDGAVQALVDLVVERVALLSTQL